MPNLPRPLPRLRRTASVGGPDRVLAANEPSEPEIIEASGLRWINITRPRLADQDWLEEGFGFHPLDFEDVYSRNQRPKLDSYDDYLFIVLQFPVFEKTTGRLISTELDLFIGPDYVLTLPNDPIPPLDALFERYSEKEEMREQVFSKGPGYLLYKLVDACVDASFPMLRKVGLKLERIEDDIFEQDAPDVVRDISNVKQEIINFRKIVRPMRAVLRDLERTKQRYLAEDLEIYFDDISDAAERVWDILENYKEVVEGLESTNESAISHRLNDTLRVLTAFSVAFLPLTLIASIFGMNVDLPGERVRRRVLDHHGPPRRDLRRAHPVVPPPGLAVGPPGRRACRRTQAAAPKPPHPSRAHPSRAHPSRALHQVHVTGADPRLDCPPMSVCCARCKDRCPPCRSGRPGAGSLHQVHVSGSMARSTVGYVHGVQRRFGCLHPLQRHGEAPARRGAGTARRRHGEATALILRPAGRAPRGRCTSRRAG